MTHDIMTVRDLKRAVRCASRVFVQARFGSSEQWLRITKAEATVLVDALPQGSTPSNSEMYSGRFGAAHGDDLYLG